MIPRLSISRTLTAGGIALLLALWAVSLQRRLQPDPLPREYQLLLQAIVRIADHNPLGRQPLSFTIAPGSLAADLARERGLCKQSECNFFSQLDPFRNYDKSWDEIMRQAYGVGDIEAWAASNGTVTISRASFRIYGPHQGWLACTLAHELSHIRRNHIFAHSYYTNTTLKGLDEKERHDLGIAQARAQELEADRDSAEIMIRSGLPGRTCLDNLIFLHYSSGDGRDTEPDSSHPGYNNRIASLRRHIQHLESSGKAVLLAAQGRDHAKASTGSAGSFSYDRNNNLLISVSR